MPISPIPPSARNTSSSPGGRCWAVGDCSITLSSFPRPLDGNLAVGQAPLSAAAIAHDECTVVGKIDECPHDLLPAGIDLERLPARAAARAPGLPHGRKTDT